MELRNLTKDTLKLIALEKSIKIMKIKDIDSIIVQQGKSDYLIINAETNGKPDSITVSKELFDRFNEIAEPLRKY